MWFKSCPRCNNGDMYLDEDNDRHCMQCGFKEYWSTAGASRPGEEKIRALLEEFLGKERLAVSA